jgi:hypothetical protein
VLLLLLFLLVDPILCFWHFSLSTSDIDGVTDSQVPFIPSTEVLVKCLFFIAPYAIEHGSRSYSWVILCSHHPCISSSTSPAAVWKVRSCTFILLHFYMFLTAWFIWFQRLQRRLRQRQILFIDLISSNISIICKVVTNLYIVLIYLMSSSIWSFCLFLLQC